MLTIAFASNTKLNHCDARASPLVAVVVCIVVVDDDETLRLCLLRGAAVEIVVVTGVGGLCDEQ